MRNVIPEQIIPCARKYSVSINKFFHQGKERAIKNTQLALSMISVAELTLPSVFLRLST